MADKNGDMRAIVLRTLIEMGGPVSFRGLKGKSADKQSDKRQLVNYHLGKLVDDGVVVSELTAGGEREYRVKEDLYTPGLLSMIEWNIRVMLLLIGEDPKKADKKALDALFDIMKASACALQGDK